MRSYLLAALAIALACNGSAGPTGPTGAAGPAGGPAGWIDVTTSGCAPAAIPDDGLDDAPAFQCALDMLAAHGGVLHVPAGTFDIHATLAVHDFTTVLGDGEGTILHQPHALLGPVLELGVATAVRHVKLAQDQPAPGPGWAPYSDYDFQIKVLHDRTTLEDLMLLNPYRGISIAPPADTGAVGQVFVSLIRGQPLSVGIQIDHALDVIHVERLHLWPFWSGDPAVIGWTEGNGTAIRSLRDDNPQFSQMFFFGYTRGVELGQSTCNGNCGITSKAKISEMDCDFCGVGVYVSGPGTRGTTIHQMSVQGFPGAGAGVDIEASGCSLFLDGGDFTTLASNGVRASGTNLAIQVTSTMVREWNTSGAGFPAFELVGGAGGSFNVASSMTGNGHGNGPVSSAGVVTSNVTANAAL